MFLIYYNNKIILVKQQILMSGSKKFKQSMINQLKNLSKILNWNNRVLLMNNLNLKIYQKKKKISNWKKSKIKNI